MYLDAYLDREYVSNSYLKLLGITCLHIAMKVEEVDLVSLRDILRPPANAHIDDVVTSQQVEAMERQVVTALNFKLLPDTLYFWFDLGVQLWDLFVGQEAANFGCRLFKPQEVVKDLSKYEPLKNCFQLGSYNRYRVAVQALDLMSLHYAIHKFSRPSLILALLALVYMREVGLIAPTPYSNLF